MQLGDSVLFKHFDFNLRGSIFGIPQEVSFQNKTYNFCVIEEEFTGTLCIIDTNLVKMSGEKKIFICEILPDKIIYNTRSHDVYKDFSFVIW